MSNSRELRQHYETVKKLLQTDEFKSPKGETAILAMLAGQPFPEAISPELKKHCEPFLTLLKYPNQNVSNLTRMAMNLALLPTSAQGRDVVTRFEPHSLFEPHSFEKDTSPLDRTHTGFVNCIFNTFTPIQFNAFCETIKASNIEDITWTDTDAGSEKFKAFCEAIGGKSKVIMLDIHYTDLKLFDKECMQALFNIIRSKLTYFDMDWNNLPRDKDIFYNFCHAIEESKLNHLYFNQDSKQSLIDIGSENLEALSKAVINNFNLRSIGNVPNVLFETIGPALKRNRNLDDAKSSIPKALEQLSITEPDKAPSYKKIIESAEACVQLIQNAILSLMLYENDENANENLKALAKKEMKELATLESKLIRKTIHWLQDKKEDANAIDFLLGIPSTNSCYLEAHALAFQIAYNGHYNPKVETTQAALTAFINALPCCLNDEGTLLKFSASDQVAIDGCLIAAAGIIKGEMDKVYNIKPEERIALLQYILLRSLNSTLSEPSPNPHILFQEQTAGLNKQLSLLPSIHSLSEIDKLNPKLNEAWAKATIVSKSLEDENMRLLFQAVSRLNNPEIIAQNIKNLGK